jgi:hypothetical protein
MAQVVLPPFQIMESIAGGNGLKSVVIRCSEPTALVVLQPLFKLNHGKYIARRIQF